MIGFRVPGFPLSPFPWIHEATIISPQPSSSSAFGEVVALSGTTLLVGASNDNAPGGGRGGAYLFIDEFSFSLALSGPVLFVGAPGANRATFFMCNAAGGWTELQSLITADPNNTNFGKSAAFSSGYAAIGAPRWPNTSLSERWGAVSLWFSEPVVRCGGNLDGIFCDRFESVTIDGDNRITVRGTGNAPVFYAKYNQLWEADTVTVTGLTVTHGGACAAAASCRGRAS